MESNDMLIIAVVLGIAYAVIMLVAVLNIWRLLSKLAGEEKNNEGDNE